MDALDQAAEKLTCDKNKLGALFDIIELDGRPYIVERSFLRWLAERNAELEGKKASK